MSIIKRMIADNPELIKFTESDQYKLSLRLLEIRYDLSYSPEEAADLLGLSLYRYVQLESGDLEIDADEYLNYVEKFEKYLNKVD